MTSNVAAVTIQLERFSSTSTINLSLYGGMWLSELSELIKSFPEVLMIHACDGSDDWYWEAPLLDERDAMVRQRLVSTIHLLKEEEYKARRERERIVKAVESGCWWDLQSYFGSYTVESLCEIAQSDRGYYLGEDKCRDV